MHPTSGLWFTRHLKIIIFVTFRRPKIHHLRNFPPTVLDILTTEFNVRHSIRRALTRSTGKNDGCSKWSCQFREISFRDKKNRSRSEIFDFQTSPNLHAYYSISLCRRQGKLYESFYHFSNNLATKSHHRDNTFNRKFKKHKVTRRPPELPRNTPGVPRRLIWRRRFESQDIWKSLFSQHFGDQKSIT